MRRTNETGRRDDGPEAYAISLFELNRMINEVIDMRFDDSLFWVRAEMSDVRVNATSGHCYLELVEKNPRTERIVAKIRGMIWADDFRRLKRYFESQAGQAFTSGLKVLVRVMVTFHEVYGLSLMIIDIDPSYTLGDMARRRAEIIRRLMEDGVFDLNKELPLPALPQRVAIITSPTAAGYEDFLDQLRRSAGGYVFYPKLFPAVMQGERAEASLIAALDAVYRHRTLFDVVVIIRGGGSTSDLNCFDSYALATHCAQFPLPIITGIGHERDETVLDLVAHTRAKTPTAAAEFLIGRMDEVAATLNALGERLRAAALGTLDSLANALAANRQRLPLAVRVRLERAHGLLENLRLRLREKSLARLTTERHFLEKTDQYLRLASPEHILKRGYSLTLKDGRIVKSVSELREGDRVVTRFADGLAESRVSLTKPLLEDPE